MADKEQEIQNIMRASGVSRVDAEFIYGIEHDEIQGDVIEINPENPVADDDDSEGDVG